MEIIDSTCELFLTYYLHLWGLRPIPNIFVTGRALPLTLAKRVPVVQLCHVYNKTRYILHVLARVCGRCGSENFEFKVTWLNLAVLISNSAQAHWRWLYGFFLWKSATPDTQVSGYVSWLLLTSDYRVYLLAVDSCSFVSTCELVFRPWCSHNTRYYQERCNCLRVYRSLLSWTGGGEGRRGGFHRWAWLGAAPFDLGCLWSVFRHTPLAVSLLLWLPDGNISQILELLLCYSLGSSINLSSFLWPYADAVQVLVYLWHDKSLRRLQGRVTRFIPSL